MTERIAYLNGEFVAESELKVHIFDRGFTRGDTVFDVARTFDGKPFRLREHMERLWRSLTYVRIDPGMSLEEMERLSLEVLERNEHLRQAGEDYMIEQFVTRGYTRPAAVRMADPIPPTVGIFAYPLPFHAYTNDYTNGAHVVMPNTRSYPTQSLEPKLKHYSRLNFSMAELESADIDPDAHPVLLDLDGNITESPVANFFVVTNGVIRTPDDRDLLVGISRQVVLELADQLGIPTSEEDLQPYDAYTADEAFLANSLYCVLPVGRVDNRELRGDVPGPITQKLLAAWSEMVGVDIVDQSVNAARRQSASS